MIPRSSALTSALHTVVAHHEGRAKENVRNISYGTNRPIRVLFMSFHEHNYDSLLFEDMTLDLSSDCRHYREWHAAGWAPVP